MVVIERLAEARDRRTKIVATIGPATSSEEALRALLQAGMNVARLNFSHGTPEEHRETIERLRRLAEELAIPVAILQDLPGPKVRIGAFADGSVELRAGAPFTLTTRAILGSPEAVSVSYAGLPEAVAPEDRLLLADGAVELRVREIEGSEIRCTVVTGGMLSARKGVNVPSGLPGLPILSEKDLRDLRFGLQHGVDYVGLSFVRTAEDVRTAKHEIAALDGRAPVIAKIETRAALDHLDEILAETDGVMVARGDLSIETPFTRVPVVQKAVIAAANRRAKPAITATQMLYSMVESPTPTRAEVADVANAIVDGSDAVMLSEETAVGRHPVRAVQTMAAIAADTDRAGPWRAGGSGDETDASPTEHEAVVEAGVPAGRAPGRGGDRHHHAGRGDRAPGGEVPAAATDPRRHATPRDVPPAGARPGGGAGPAPDERGDARGTRGRGAGRRQRARMGGRPGIFVARDLVRCVTV